MTSLGYIVYKYRESKTPDVVLYEKLSNVYTWRLQQQCALRDLTLGKVFCSVWRDIWQSCLVRLEVLRRRNKVMVWYVHSHNGTFKSGPKCKGLCPHCIEHKVFHGTWGRAIRHTVNGKDI